MPLHFDPHLVNDPFSDPGLYVDLVFERRALLFDLGDVSILSPRSLLRITDIFISHRHMDHFAGFDHLLRIVLGRDQTIRLYGTPGLITAVGHKLQAYTWNLTGSYEGDLVFEVAELHDDGRLASARFLRSAEFAREDLPDRSAEGGLLLAEPGLQVRAAALDHDIPSLAFALEERAQINIWRNKLDAMGLATGAWLRSFKEAILRNDPDDTPIEALCAPGGEEERRTFPLGLLRKEIMQVTSGRKIAYVVDTAFTDSNIEKIVALTKNADVLFIESTFLHIEAARAAARRHLTAHQAGTLARLADVKRLVTFHYSPRYKGRGKELDGEAQAAFTGAVLDMDAAAPAVASEA
jgi:ribonuclease Z